MHRNSLDKSCNSLTEDITIPDLNLCTSKQFLHAPFRRHTWLEVEVEVFFMPTRIGNKT